MPSEDATSKILTDRCPPELSGRCEVCIRNVGFERAHVLNGFTSAGGDLPEVGDVTICAYCGTLVTFARGGVFPEAPPNVLHALNPDTLKEIQRVQRVLREKLDTKGWS